MYTDVTRGIGTWPGADMVPRWPESRQSNWRDSVTLTAMARLT
jgi:hypothetical protein